MFPPNCVVMVQKRDEKQRGKYEDWEDRVLDRGHRRPGIPFLVRPCVAYLVL